jgi:hypothetical protein
MWQIAEPLAVICPTCPAPSAKIFLFFRNANQMYMIGHPVLLRGALAIVTNVGRVAVDATASGTQRQSQGEMNLVSGMRQADERRLSPAEPFGEDGWLRTAKPCGPGIRC